MVKRIFFGCMMLFRGEETHRYFASGLAKTSGEFEAKMRREAKKDQPGWVQEKVFPVYEIDSNDILDAADSLKGRRKKA